MITLYLHGRVATSPQALEEFFARARIVYEAPAGIRARLQWRIDDPTAFVEVFEYRDRAVYELDQQRVETDPAMLALLAEWRTHLAGPPEISVYADLNAP